MILQIRLCGVEVLHVELSDSPSPEPDDKTRDLSGGSLASSTIEAGRTEMYMGFTNGRADE